MSPHVIWNSEEDEVLIEFVRGHEALFNPKSKDYRKAQLKQSLWANIGVVLEKSDSDCCKRWVYIRDYYIRRRGKPGSGTSGEAAKKRANLLSFLDSYTSSQRISITSADDDENPDDESEVMNRSIKVENQDYTQIEETEDTDNNKEDKRDEMKEKKRKRYTHSEELLNLFKDIAQRNVGSRTKELDETDLFFNSMAQITKKLPRYEQAQLRMAISSIVGKAELRCIANESYQTSYGPDTE